MSEIWRQSGAILAQSEGQVYLVGNTKAPCDWEAIGLVPPAERDAAAIPWIKLTVQPGQTMAPTGVVVTTTLEGEELPQRLAERLLITRNGSVSERLWNLITGTDPDQPSSSELPSKATPSIQWLVDMPANVWEVVRDSVLRCI